MTKRTLTQRIAALERKFKVVAMELEVIRLTRKFKPSENMEGPKPTTVEGWLKTLPEPVRSKALKNMRGRRDRNVTNNECLRLSNAIWDAFIWHSSKEGTDYWVTEYGKAQTVEGK